MSVLRNSHEADSERWPTLTRNLITAAGVAATAIDLAIRQFRATQVYVECDQTGDPVLTPGADGDRWVYAYSRRDWVPGIDAGQDVDLLSLTGLELTRRLRKGTGVQLDPGHDHALVIIAAEVTNSVEHQEDDPALGGDDRR